MNQHANTVFTILVFPATHPDGLNYIEMARTHGYPVVAATSEFDAEFSTDTTQISLLPYVYDITFPERFLELVNLHHITKVFSPVASVYIWLKYFISKNNLPIQLIGSSPTHKEADKFRNILNITEFFSPFINQCSDHKNKLNTFEIAAIFRMSSHIYGESNDTKIAAMMGIFSNAPKGDIIEIGTLLGKSASVLTFLARRYETGSVLAIDPWQWATGKQHDSPETVSVHMENSWDYEKLPLNFIVNMLPVGFGIFNYIKAESEQAFGFFNQNPIVTSQEFGQTNYQGKVSVIHVDGNHDYAKVKLDCDLWLPLLMPGAWLILDDYLWIHGTGPRRVGDDLLEKHSKNIDRAFVCGKALFIKFCYFSDQNI